MSAKTPFDHVAQTYDEDFNNTIIGRLQRERVWRYLNKRLPENKQLNILEINCGTGEDAYWLASKGHKVIATDASQEMINACKPKENIRFVKASFDELAVLFNDQKFDLIFSNFAGLNCVDEGALKKLNEDFRHLLKPDGLLVTVLLGKYCWLERLFFSLKGDVVNRNRRLNKTNARLTEGVYQSTWCYDTKQLSTIFIHFRVQKKQPIGIIIPPSYLEPLIKKAAFMVPLLKSLESMLSVFSFLTDRGDHAYFEWRRAK